MQPSEPDYSFGTFPDSQLQLAADPAYWRDLNPHMTIGEPYGSNPWESGGQIPEAALAEAVSTYRALGFLSLAAVLAPSQMARMNTALHRLRNANWPAVCLFLYDDLWSVARNSLIQELLTRLLGVEYRQQARIWAHYVPCAAGNSGWLPHVDAGDEGRPGVSLWVPLTAATLTNGCMYVVKRDERIPETVGKSRDRSDFSPEEVMTILRSVRALPATPGDILCWDETTLHWGAAYESGGEPRTSFALEFTTASGDASVDQELLDPFAPQPDFETRLRLIAQSIITYRRFEPAVEPLVDLANHILGGREASSRAAT